MSARNVDVATSRNWLIAGWVCVAIWLAGFPIAALLGFGAMMFCDSPGEPCNSLGQLILITGALYLVLLFSIVHGLVRRKFGWILKLLAISGALFFGGGTLWLRSVL